MVYRFLLFKTNVTIIIYMPPCAQMKHFLNGTYINGYLAGHRICTLIILLHNFDLLSHIDFITLCQVKFYFLSSKWKQMHYAPFVLNRCAQDLSKNLIMGAPGWLSQLRVQLLISAQVMISWFVSLSPASGPELSLLGILSLSLSLSAPPLFMLFLFLFLSK